MVTINRASGVDNIYYMINYSNIRIRFVTKEFDIGMRYFKIPKALLVLHFSTCVVKWVELYVKLNLPGVCMIFDNVKALSIDQYKEYSISYDVQQLRVHRCFAK